VPTKELVFKSQKISPHMVLTVLVGSRNFESAEVAAKEVGPDAHALQLDVKNQASITTAAARVRSEFGRLDVLIQNAAISNTNKLPGQSVAEYAATTRPSNVALDEMRAVWETNVFGFLPFTRRCCRFYAKHRTPALSTCRAASAR
jgi:NAD(P)-dependent dehydrogenase (short-subunit alcohol dehydrogenase family)